MTAQEIWLNCLGFLGLYDLSRKLICSDTVTRRPDPKSWIRLNLKRYSELELRANPRTKRIWCFSALSLKEWRRQSDAGGFLWAKMVNQQRRKGFTFQSMLSLVLSGCPVPFLSHSGAEEKRKSPASHDSCLQRSNPVCCGNIWRDGGWGLRGWKKGQATN